MRPACVRVEQQSAHPLAEGAEIGLSLPLDEADPAVEALKDRAMRLVVVGGEAGGAQHGGHAGERDPVTLRREGVDQRRE